MSVSKNMTFQFLVWKDKLSKTDNKKNYTCESKKYEITDNKNNKKCLDTS